MKIKYIGKGSYYHHPYLFDKNKNTHDVEEDVGIALLEQPKLFQQIAESKEKEDPEKEIKEPDDVNDADEEASEQKKLHEESKKEAKKRVSKKDK